MGTILLIVLIVLLLGSFPTYPYSREWGYRPSGLLTLLVVIMVVLLIMGIFPWGWGPTSVSSPVIVP